MVVSYYSPVPSSPCKNPVAANSRIRKGIFFTPPCTIKCPGRDLLLGKKLVRPVTLAYTTPKNDFLGVVRECEPELSRKTSKKIQSGVKISKGVVTGEQLEYRSIPG